jgi:hypothetical protein
MAYVLREDPDPSVIDDGWGEPDLQQELMEQGHHNGAHWRHDNGVVFDFMKEKVHGTKAWGTIKQFERASHGREAFLALIALYLGPDVTELLMKQAEETLNTTRFDRNSKNFPFDKFVGKMRQCFLDLNRDVPQAYMIRKLADAVDVLKSQWQATGPHFHSNLAHSVHPDMTHCLTHFSQLHAGRPAFPRCSPLIAPAHAQPLAWQHPALTSR